MLGFGLTKEKVLAKLEEFRVANNSLVHQMATAVENKNYTLYTKLLAEYGELYKQMQNFSKKIEKQFPKGFAS